MTIGSFGAGVRLALVTTREHKMRSFLTVLGVIIGTGAVIGVGSIIAGLDGAITGLIRTFGPETIIVTKTTAMGNATREERARKPLTLENARAIELRCPSVEHVSPYLFPPNGIHSARYGGNDVYQIQLGGTEESYAAGGTTMKSGRFFTDTENTHHMPVVVIGEDVGKQLFANQDPIDRRISIDGHELAVVGVMDRPAASLPGQNDTRVLLPYHTMRKMFPNAQEHMLVTLAYPGMVDKAQDEIRSALRIERRVPFDKPDTFSMTTAAQMIEDFHRVTATVAIVMVILSSIGLLVGGIGVMNIMLVSVTERTREIGIRKAVGARKSDIIVQFLTEAVVLTGLGGLLGLTLGWMISRACSLIFPNLPTAVPLWAAVSGVAVSVGVGLFFGIWPAGRAARLDPVEALRYE
ncbi:MAG TPA: ABC transporter permease [Candidatus Sulfopaludibacter sp.]|jgi:putative ABC transport system permease protein|nr:ABC transporter permease [Candidatus Sulfopaludibacter sp.]